MCGHVRRARAAPLYCGALAATVALGCGGDRSVSTTSAAVTGPLRRPAPTTVRVLVAGDVIPHRPVLVDPARIAEGLAPMASLFSTADAVIVNHEAATGDATKIPRPKEVLAAPPGWA